MAMDAERVMGVERASGRTKFRRGARFWAKAIAERRALGVGVERFCLERGLARSTFHKWSVRLGERTTAVQGVRPKASKALRVTGREPRVKFVPLSVTPRLHGVLGCEREAVEIVLEAGMRVRLMGEAAARVIGVLLTRIDGAGRG